MTGSMIQQLAIQTCVSAATAIASQLANAACPTRRQDNNVETKNDEESILDMTNDIMQNRRFNVTPQTPIRSIGEPPLGM